VLAAVALALAVRGTPPSERDAGAPRSAGRRAATLVAGGLLTMSAVYSAYFRTPWYPATGREGFVSGVHVVAALGFALVAGGVVQLLLLAPRRLVAPALLAPSLAVGLLAGFGDLVQRDHVASWRFQRQFWRAYAELCRDAGDRTFVLALDRELPPVRYTDLLSWTAEILPGALFTYRDVVAVPPAVLLAEHDPTRIASSPTGYRWRPTLHYMLPKGDQEQPEPGNVIVLERSAGRWIRITGEVPAYGGGTFRLRDPGPDLLGRLTPTRLARVFGAAP